jgi:hypothetical protein
MRDVEGVTTKIVDHGHKRRADSEITDEELIGALRGSLFHRLRPLIQRAFQFDATRVERWIVACYDAGAAAISARTATTPPRAPRIASSR